MKDMERVVWFKYRVSLDVCAMFNADEVLVAESGEHEVKESLERILGIASNNDEGLADGEVLMVTSLSE